MDDEGINYHNANTEILIPESVDFGLKTESSPVENLPGIQSCLQKTISEVQCFQSELRSTRESLNSFTEITDSNANITDDKIGISMTGQHRYDQQRIMPDNQFDVALNNLINKTEHLLLQVKMQIDFTYIDLEQLKSHLTFNTRHVLPNIVSGEPLPSDLDTRHSMNDTDKLDGNGRSRDDEIRPYWKDWPPFVYMNPRRNKFKQKVCCVLLSKPGTFEKDDLQVYASDTDQNLAKCLESNDEQILSSLVTLESKDGCIHVTEITLIGTELQTQQLHSLQCVAVALPPLEKFKVTESGAIIELQNDRNIKLYIPPNAFNDEVTVTTKTKLMTENGITDASRRYVELEHVKQASSLLTISSTNPTLSDIEVSLHDFRDEDYNNMTEKQEIMARCSRWIVNNLNFNKIKTRLHEIFPKEAMQRIMKEEFSGDKIRILLSELRCSDNMVDKFISLLEETAQHVADRVRSVQKQVTLSRENDSSSVTDLELSSDFDPEFELMVERVKVVSKSENQSWTVKPVITSDSSPSVHTVKLDGGSSSYSILGMIVPNRMSNSDVCRAASVLEDVSCLTLANLIVKQHKEHPDDIVIQCVRAEHAQKRLQELSKRGFTEGPGKMPQFGMSDGEEIEMTFDTFCLEGYENKALKMTFYSGLNTAICEGRLRLQNPERKIECDRYTGQLTYSVVSKKVPIQRSGSLIVHLPKPTDEQIGYFSYTLDVPAKAIAKFLAWQLTSDNANSTRWIKYANNLVKEASIYKYCTSHVNKDNCKANQRQRCEAYLLYWADHYVDHHENKIERMIDILGPDIRSRTEALQFIKPYCLSGTLSNEGLKKMAYCLAEDWEVMASKLGFDKSVVVDIKETQKNQITQCLKMLDTWRLSDMAIMKGTDILKHLYECAKAAKCSIKLSTMNVRYS